MNQRGYRYPLTGTVPNNWVLTEFSVTVDGHWLGSFSPRIWGEDAWLAAGWDSWPGSPCSVQTLMQSRTQRLGSNRRTIYIPVLSAEWVLGYFWQPRVGWGQEKRQTGRPGYQYENLGKSLDYIPTASGRARSRKEVSFEYENLGKSLYYILTASGRVR